MRNLRSGDLRALHITVKNLIQMRLERHPLPHPENCGFNRLFWSSQTTTGSWCLTRLLKLLQF